MKNEFKDIARRIENAHNDFIANVVEQFNVTTEDAEKVLRVFKKAKAVKLAVGIGRYELTHGAFWEKDVIHRAIAQA